MEELEQALYDLISSGHSSQTRQRLKIAISDALSTYKTEIKEEVLLELTRDYELTRRPQY